MEVSRFSRALLTIALALFVAAIAVPVVEREDPVVTSAAPPPGLRADTLNASIVRGREDVEIWYRVDEANRQREAEAEAERAAKAAARAEARRRAEAAVVKSSRGAPRSTAPVVDNLSANQQLGRTLMLEIWGEDQWPCLLHLWGPLEGGWSITATNPRSGAYGIPQALPPTKMGPGWQSSAEVQIRWGLSYIAGRYGTPCNARAARLSKGWY